MEVAIRTSEEIGYIREAGRIVAACHEQIAQWITPGISTMEINERVEGFILGEQAVPEQKGFKGYPYATCASVNEIVCHGFPSDYRLREGDVVTIDLVVNKDGWMADRGWTYPVGKINRQAAHLLKWSLKSLMAGIEAAWPGSTLGDIGCAVERTVRRGKIGVVRPLVGHGIGREMHEPPDVVHYGVRGEGMRLQKGMVITIEPVCTLGSTGAVFWGEDGWTITSADGSWGAQYEHTLAITAEGPRILTG
ncbi:type I methionyl aminopeptidase [Paenibacillus sp. JX-17]|uniref:Methionine aminopeptidase n=1 Tax=Paenibacillus lacisoli TaxID=3064525 RepID=A0ABT9CGB2_9BACL|nr:type I methionyl aminopeptidase [Paenibacillus sp. JX-17]MDO7906643.1 type I methionyl aminopeptidase [Paenibacillus sp. JX-17]